MTATSPNRLSKRSTKDLQAATEQVIRLARGEQQEWPQRLLTAALTRDSDYLVIRRLAQLAGGAAIVLSQASGQTRTDAVRWIASQMPSLSDGIAPYSGLAWRRGIDLVLHQLGEPLDVSGNGAIEAVDLAGALLTLHMIGVIAAAGWEHNPQHMRTTLRPDANTSASADSPPSTG